MPTLSPFCSPNEPIPGLDRGYSFTKKDTKSFSLFGKTVETKSCSRLTLAPRAIHGLEIVDSNRLDEDWEAKIPIIAGIGILLGRSTTKSPRSRYTLLEENTYGRIGVSLSIFGGEFSITHSNDVFFGNDHGYTGVGIFEFQKQIRLSDSLNLIAIRLRVIGTSGIPIRDAGTTKIGGRKFYNQVIHEIAAQGAVTLDMSGSYKEIPVNLSIALLDDRVRQKLQGMIHRKINSPEFLSTANAKRGIYLSFCVEF